MFGGALSYCPSPYGFTMFLSPFLHCGLISLRHFLLRQRGHFRNVFKGDVIFRYRIIRVSAGRVIHCDVRLSDSRIVFPKSLAYSRTVHKGCLK